MPKISIQKFKKKYGEQLANIDKHTSKQAPKTLKMTPSWGEDAQRMFLTLWVIQAKSVNSYVKQLNGIQEIENIEKVTVHKNSSKQLPWGEWQVWKQFHGFIPPMDYKYLEVFETNFCNTLRNNGISKQTDKQTNLLNSLTGVENTE